MVHRFGAVAAGAVAVVVAVRVFRAAAGVPWLRALAMLPALLVVVQIGLGVASVLSLLNLAVITTHLAVGAALLGSFVLLWCLCPAESRSRERPFVARAPSTDGVAAT